MYKGYFVFDKPWKDLRAEGEIRRGEGVGWGEGELGIVMEGVVKGLKFLKGLGQKHEAVCTGNILVSKEGEVLLTDPWLNPQQVNGWYRSKNRVYFAPERLESEK